MTLWGLRLRWLALGLGAGFIAGGVFGAYVLT